MQGRPGLFDARLEYENRKIALEPGDTVLFFTDGISDAFSVEGESFGIERLQAACESQLGASPVGLLREVFAAVKLCTRQGPARRHGSRGVPLQRRLMQRGETCCRRNSVS
jgi:serine phosphatase RsbU (regulator of sigma subunit)